jgi:hypothetical protein
MFLQVKSSALVMLTVDSSNMSARSSYNEDGDLNANVQPTKTHHSLENGRGSEKKYALVKSELTTLETSSDLIEWPSPVVRKFALCEQEANILMAIGQRDYELRRW